MKKNILTMLIALSISLPAITHCYAKDADSAATVHLLSRGKPVYASSVDGGDIPEHAVDGNTATRWSSAWGSDREWIYVDLGASASIKRIVIRWENAYATAYSIQVSSDEFIWKDVYLTSEGKGGIETMEVSGKGRYVRLYATTRVLPAYGYSIWEFEVYGMGGIIAPAGRAMPNVALKKAASASSMENDSTAPAYAADGDIKTRWSSNAFDGEWLSVDLGQACTIGRVEIKWEAAFGRVYDIQVSDDAKDWKTVYRQLHGIGGIEKIPLCVSGRYVRLYCYARGTGFGYSLWEFEVYKYNEGDPKPEPVIPPIPSPSITAVGKGNYVEDITLVQPRYPKNKSEFKPPLPSNKWWTSILIEHLGNGIIPLPLKCRYTQKGLSILNPGKPWLNADGGALETTGEPDLYVIAGNINTSAMETKLGGYGDWSAEAILSDDATSKMRTTFVKGSPYLFMRFLDPASPQIYSAVVTRFFDDSGKSVLAKDGASLTADHIGIEVTNVTGAPTPEKRKRYYGLFGPEGTVFRRVGNKIKIVLGGGDYLSLATLPAFGDLKYMHQHAYAFVTDTKVSWNYDAPTAKVTTSFNAATQLVRTGFSDKTLMCLFPHQWKNSSVSLTKLTYDTVRGLMKVHEGNSFTVENKFYGITPSFPEPASSSYTRAQMQAYLTGYREMVENDYMVADPYWQGKKLHTLSMAILIADQIGEIESRDLFIKILKTILTNWFTFDGKKEYPYYLYYSPDWGALNGDGGDHGMAANLSDHNFVWGYYTFSSAVLAMYDKDFMRDYGGIVEHLIRDYADPSRIDPMYPFMRSLDVYEGHSWAGGYGDNVSGNNQESASEALFAWAGMYLWGLVTGNDTYRDAGIWGFITEENAIEQYWFNYDRDAGIWPAEYPHGVVGMVWGSAYLYGTYFSGDANNIYGIHWLPTAEYITYYGRRPDAAARLYKSFLQDKGGPEDGWQHIIWSFQSLSDPQGVLAKWNDKLLQKDEAFNTYWFVQNMNALGQRSMDIWAANWSSYSVFRKDSVYTAIIWNPTDNEISVEFRNSSGVVGTVRVPSKSMVAAGLTKPN